MPPKSRLPNPRLATLVLLVLLALGSGAWALSHFSRGPAEVAVAVLDASGSGAYAAPDTSHGGRGGRLKVATLNIAHGRSNGLHQVLLPRARIQANLDAIAALLRREAPEVVSLQEADGPSLWSGRFDHVRYLAEKAGFRYHSRGRHVQAPGLRYGTALLSRDALTDPRSVAFRPSPPTPPKGFLVAAVHPPGRPDLELDVVSVHLDFASARVRARQIDTMIRHLSGRGRPMVVMGDFNCGWTDGSSGLRRLAEGLSLQTWKPEERDLVTFAATGKRLDWILVSPGLQIKRHQVLQDVVSDHKAVVAEILLPPQTVETR